MSKANRPWQGTTMGILAVVDTVGTFTVAFLLLFAKEMMTGFLGGITGSLNLDFSNMPIFDYLDGSEKLVNTMTENVVGMLSGITTGLAIFCLVMGTLNLFIARGLFKGQRWAVILVTIFAGLALLGSVGQFMSGVQSLESSIVSFGFLGFIFYLCVFCWGNKFYGSKK